MSEERRPDDPTRRILRVFGVTVSNYEEKTARLLEAKFDDMPPDELAKLASEAMELTAGLDQVLQDTTNHVLEIQVRVLAQIKAALERAQQS
jgi:hypothetical protein